MTAKHTPGPWRVLRWSRWGPDSIGWAVCQPLILHSVDQGPDAAIARILTAETQEITDANAYLIAQAPTLLAQRDALAKALRRLLCDCYQEDGRTVDFGCYLHSETVYNRACEYHAEKGLTDKRAQARAALKSLEQGP